MTTDKVCRPLCSFSSLGCPEATWPELLALAGSCGFPAVEVRTLEKRLDLPALVEEKYGGAGRWKEDLERAGRRISALDTSAKFFGQTDEQWAELLRFAELAEALDVPWLRVFDGPCPAGATDPATIAAARLTWQRWCEERARRGWRVDWMIETHDSLLRGATIAHLQAALPAPLPILWDTHHTWKKGGEALGDTWRQIAPWTVYLHVKDSISQPSARHPFTYVWPGEGEFPFAELWSALAATSYRGVLSLEWEKQWHPYLGALEEALRRCTRLPGWPTLS